MDDDIVGLSEAEYEAEIAKLSATPSKYLPVLSGEVAGASKQATSHEKEDDPFVSEDEPTIEAVLGGRAKFCAAAVLRVKPGVAGARIERAELILGDPSSEATALVLWGDQSRIADSVRPGQGVAIGPLRSDGVRLFSTSETRVLHVYSPSLQGPWRKSLENVSEWAKRHALTSSSSVSSSVPESNEVGSGTWPPLVFRGRELMAVGRGWTDSSSTSDAAAPVSKRDMETERILRQELETLDRSSRAVLSDSAFQTVAEFKSVVLRGRLESLRTEDGSSRAGITLSLFQSPSILVEAVLPPVFQRSSGVMEVLSEFVARKYAVFLGNWHRQGRKLQPRTGAWIAGPWNDPEPPTPKRRRQLPNNDHDDFQPFTSLSSSSSSVPTIPPSLPDTYSSPLRALRHRVPSWAKEAYRQAINNSSSTPPKTKSSSSHHIVGHCIETSSKSILLVPLASSSPQRFLLTETCPEMAPFVCAKRAAENWLSSRHSPPFPIICLLNKQKHIQSTILALPELFE